MIPESQVAGQDLLHLVMFGHLHFQSLWAGIDLGVFEALAEKGPLSLAQIAEATGVALQPAKIVMSNLVALGLVEKRGESFANGPVAARYLLRAAADSVVDVMRWQALIVYGPAEDYVRSLRENTNVGVERFPGAGKTLYERLVQRPELEKVFQDAMARMPSNRFLADALPLSGVKHLCDCGGGAGRNAIALARKHPDLRITIFDQPSVCEEARRNVAAQGLGDRIDTHAGNFLADPFPPDVDAVLYSHIGSIWSPETNVGVFRRAHSALPTGGRFFVFNMVPNDEHTGPLSVTTGSVYFHALATGEGLMHSVPDYAAMLREAGFSEVATVRDLPVSHAIVTGIR